MEKSTPYRNAWYRDLLEKEKELKEYTDEKVSNVDLSELKDVSIIDVGDGQTLVYNSETEKWVNAETKQGIIVIPISFASGFNSFNLVGMTAPDLEALCSNNKDKLVVLQDNNVGSTYPPLYRLQSETNPNELLFGTIIHQSGLGPGIAIYKKQTAKIYNRFSRLYIPGLPLPSSANNGKLLGIKNGVYSLVDPPNNDVTYTTDEQVIGTWIDGKPLYQKTYTVTFPSNTFIADIGNEICIKNVYGGVYDNQEQSFVPIGYQSQVRFNSDVISGQQRITFYNEFIDSRPLGEFTIQYTKNTDTVD